MSLKRPAVNNLFSGGTGGYKGASPRQSNFVCVWLFCRDLVSGPSQHAGSSRPPENEEWWEPLCYDPLPVGGIAVALLFGTYALLGMAPSVPLLLAGFCGVALVYGMDRGIVAAPEDTVNHPGRRRWVEAHRPWLWGEAAVLLLGGVVALSYLEGGTVLGVAVGVVLAGLHLLPVGRRGRLLKTIGVGKPIVVAGAWAVGATLLPVIEAGQPITIEAAGLAGYRFVFILPNVLLADWGDRRGDVAAGLGPWTEAGTGERLRWIAATLLLIGGGLATGLSMTSMSAGLLLVDGVGLVLMGGAVWGLRPDCPRDRLLMDLVVAWPIVTALVKWGVG